MSAVLKSVTVLSGLALTGAAAYHTVRSSSDFSRAAIATEYDPENKAIVPKARLPSNFVSFTIKGYEFKNSA